MLLGDLIQSGVRPVAPLAGFPAARLTETSIKANLTDPNLQSKSLFELYRQTRPHMALVMMDLTVEAQAMGAPVRMPDDDNPAVSAHVIGSEADMGLLKKPSGPAGRMEVFIETVKLLKKSVDAPVGAYVIGPFTLASEFVGAENAALMTITEPGLVKSLLEPSTEVISMYARNLANAGADVIVVLEPDAMYLSAQVFNEFSAPYVKRVIGALDKPAVLHVCGDTSHLVSDMAATGAAGLSLDSDVDLSWAAGRIPSETAIIGNIAPSLMLEGDEGEVAEACFKLLESMEPHRNFILSSGCDLPVDTPVGNIVAMVRSSAV